MKCFSRDLLLAVFFLPCFATASSAYTGKECNGRNCLPTERVPEGGSNLTYLIASGVVSAGALAIRWGSKKKHLS
ncbi:MAG: hypothetical protein WBS24_01680 [Terriglobales bacterium]